MSSVLPFDIIVQIIDNIGEDNDTNLLKELALVSHSFLEMCSKHLFATVELHDAFPDRHVASSKKGFVKLLKSRPDVVKYIRKLAYKVTYDSQPFSQIFVNDDLLLSPILPNLLRTIPRLNCLTIDATGMDWNAIDSSLTSALLHLMHLPTINHIDLSFIRHFPLACLIPSVNLHRLDIFYLSPLADDGFPVYDAVQSEMMPTIHEFHIAESVLLTLMLLHAKRQDRRPVFNFMGLRRLSIPSYSLRDEWNTRHLLQNAKLLEKLHLSVESSFHNRSLVGLHDILSPIARTLKVLDFTVPLFDYTVSLPLAGLCGELEAMAGHNVLEALSFEVNVRGYEPEDYIGSIIRGVETVLVKPGWSALRQVSVKISIACLRGWGETAAKLSEALQSLPDKYLSHLSKLESVAFNFSASSSVVE